MHFLDCQKTLKTKIGLGQNYQPIFCGSKQIPKYSWQKSRTQLWQISSVKIKFKCSIIINHPNHLTIPPPGWNNWRSIQRWSHPPHTWWLKKKHVVFSGFEKINRFSQATRELNCYLLLSFCFGNVDNFHPCPFLGRKHQPGVAQRAGIFRFGDTLRSQARNGGGKNFQMLNHVCPQTHA